VTPLSRALVFVGFMGSGKSTAATAVARECGVEAKDTDQLLEARFGHSIAREFELHGESAFRAHEEQLVCEVLDGAGPGVVIALGGGAVLSARVRAALAPHLTVWLEIDPAVAWERVRAQQPARPLARDPDAFAALHAERRAVYEGLADAILPAQSNGVVLRALPALRMLTAAADRSNLPGTASRESGRDAGATADRGRVQLLWADAASAEYPVFIGRGLLGQVGSPGWWPLDRAASRPFCVTDETVGELYAQRLGPLTAVIANPPGESHKTLAAAERVWRELVQAGMTRADHVVALGGGVVGDLAGFCAATYQRGVPVVQVPTTLVAQVDSAYGGKTGIDLPEAKNYVGAYHQPVAVIVDPDALRTLPAPEVNAGWVEVLKTALIAGGPLWERVSAEGSVAGQGPGDRPGAASAAGQGPGDRPGAASAAGHATAESAAAELPVAQDTILACASLKLAVVAADERDGGRRQVLNLGHTVGHAIETATAYSRYRHGEAVGLGLLAALRLSGQEALRARVHELLRARGLPVTLGGGVEIDEVVRAVAHDKKRIGAFTPFVLVRAPGDVQVGCEVSDSELRAAVAELA
jgi:shikimate kinase/3-dehydroquinate synthase